MMMIKEKLDRLREMDVDSCLFLLGNILIIICFIIEALILAFNISIGIGDNCAFHHYTGLYCIGCGGTRAMLAFFRGDFLTSMKYHSFTTYAFTFFSLFMGSHYLRFCTRGRIKGMHFRMIYIIIGVVLLVGQFIIRNFMLVRYGSVLWPVG